MSAQHTPGPWYRNIKAGGKYPIIFSGTAPNHAHIAQACQLRGKPDEVEANISLIAAAPELLAVLSRAVEDIDSGGADDADARFPWLAAARAVIAEAQA